MHWLNKRSWFCHCFLSTFELGAVHAQGVLYGQHFENARFLLVCHHLQKQKRHAQCNECHERITPYCQSKCPSNNIVCFQYLRLMSLWEMGDDDACLEISRPTRVMISGALRSVPPTNRIPHATWGELRCNVTRKLCGLGLMAFIH